MNGSIRKRRISQRRQSDKSEKEAEEKQKQASKLTEIEDAATGAVGFSVYIRYFKSIGVWMSIGAVASNALNSAAAIYSSSKSSWVSVYKEANFFGNFSLA